MIECEYGAIDYAESGPARGGCSDGTTVVLVPGSCSTGAAWRPVVAQWDGRYRWVTTSLLGYAGTEERRTSIDADMSHEADIVEAVIRRAGDAVHLVGHSFGGLAALAVALRKTVPLRSLTIIEAPAVTLLRAMREHRHFNAFRDMTDEYFGDFYTGTRDAIRHVIDFYGGPGTFAALPQRVRDYARAMTSVNVLDWTTVYRFGMSPMALAKIKVPTLVIHGAQSHPAVQRANQLLSLCIEDATLTTIADASHFMLATHAATLARLLAGHITRSAAMTRVFSEGTRWQPGQRPASFL